MIFIGYSMPRTDIAAACLFGEALQKSKQIEIVNYAKEGEGLAKDLLVASYQAALPQLSEKDFSFKGASNWLKENGFVS